MREEAPVIHHRAIVHITPHRLVERAIRETSLFSNRRGGSRVDFKAATLSDPEDRRKLYEVADFMADWLVSLDPPLHTRVRGLIHRAFTPRRIAALEASIQEITDELIERARPQGWIDVVSQLAFELPLFVIGADRTDSHRIRLWSYQLYALLRNPDQLDLLRREPSLLQAAVDEAVRWDTSVQNIHRTAHETFEFEGLEIPAGTSVRLILGSANRDPERYDDPDRFEILREGPRSLGFGVGPHYCLGVSLANAELRAAIGTLVERFPKLSLIEEPRWRANQGLRGLESLKLGLA
jgi:cytochrome P450